MIGKENNTKVSYALSDDQYAAYAWKLILLLDDFEDGTFFHF